MKKELNLFFLFLILLVFTLSFISSFSGTGDGTLANPFVITNCTQLNETRNNLAGNYSLGNNIDFEDAGCESFLTGNGWEPIGTFASVFSGSLNGKNHTIANLYINRSAQDYVGLFGRISYVSVNTIITNLGLYNVNITGKYYVGGLCGECSNFINKSFVSGEIKGGMYVGSIGGTIYKLNDCYSNATILVNAENSDLGGLAGKSFPGNIKNCYFSGIINYSNFPNFANVGGLLGNTFQGSGINSFSSSQILGNYENGVGGLFGNQLMSSSFSGNYFNNHSNNPTTCGCEMGVTCCSVIQDNASYFYDSSNAPMSSWDFNSIWAEQSSDFPIFIWQAPIDSTAPTLGLLSPLNTTYSSSTIHFNLSSNEVLSFCVFSLNDFVTNYTMTLNSSFTGANYSLGSFSTSSQSVNFWCNDSSGNINSSVEVNFSVAISVAGSSDSSGGDTSGGSSSSASNITKEYFITDVQFKNGYTQLLKESWEINFVFENENHSLNVSKINNSNQSVLVRVFSQEQSKFLKVGEIWKIDLNQDNKTYDLSVKINSISNGIVDILIQEIKEKISEDAEEDVQSAFDKNKETWLNQLSKSERVYFIVLGILIVLILADLIAIFFFQNYRRHLKKQYHNPK